MSSRRTKSSSSSPFRRARPIIMSSSSLMLLLLLLLSFADTCQGQRAATSAAATTNNNNDRRKSKKEPSPTLAAKTVHLEQADLSQVKQIFGEGIELGFENVRLTLKGKGKKPDRLILDGSAKGSAKPGRMLAIMGPSGSGKSSLIHALAGRLKESAQFASLTGKRYVNGKAVTGDSTIPAAFIEQDVNFFPHMTVRETLEFRVRLKLGRKMGTSAQKDIVSKIMEELSLTKSADTIVGDSKVRGISGGERKRLSIACEMISSPSIIFLDEPTSGLDSYQATQVVETLNTLADSGKTIIAVIHQPSQHVFAMFDDLLLLSEGKMMYFGEVKAVRSYFEKLGFPAAKETGTAEHVLDCISEVMVDGKPTEESERKINHIAASCREHSSQLSLGKEVKDNASTNGRKLIRYDTENGRPGANIFRQFNLLMKRAIKEVFRSKGAIIIKLVQQVTLGVVYGGIYHLGTNQASIQDRIGLLSLIAIGATNMAMAATIRAFPKEKVIVSDEIAKSMYGTLPYFVAKAVSEIPLIGVFSTVFSSIIYPLTGLQPAKFNNFLGLSYLHSVCSEGAGLLLGAISPNSDVALALFPPIVVLNIIFDGKNISEENTPPLLRWISKVSLIRWGFEGLALNEFDGLKFDTGGPRRGPVAKTGEEALARFGLGDRTVGQVVRAQALIIAGSWTLSYLGLTLNRQKFMEMEQP